MEEKKSRINNTDDLIVDRINSLPDSILGHILSFLPTKEAVATDILSKRWKFVWVTVHNLDFHDSEDSWDEDEIMKFIRFVDRVLLLHDGGSLNKFSLVWYDGVISSYVCSWINTAITKNVHELYLYLGNGEVVEIPVSGFNSDSLQSLEVTDLTLLDDKTVVYLPRLESLKLDGVYFKSKEVWEKLICGCPILHYLKLTICFRDDYDDDDDDDSTFIISSATLRRLDISFGFNSRLKLKASSLEYLRLSGCITEIFVEKSLSSLVEADFHISLARYDSLQLDGQDFLNNSIVEAVRAFNCVKFLSLSTDVLLALSSATISLSTEFPRLVRLTARTYCHSLQDFIRSSCNLEALIIDKDCWRDTSHPHDHPSWNAIVQVPRCLSNSLKEVCFDNYNGSEDEREMIRYMLKHGSFLEVMDISCYDKGDSEKLKLLQEICVFPRKSPVCKVQFLL